MTRKFAYSPGLPGYGTRGVDGSAGLTGIATYFSAYDGNSDSVTIKSKIISNKELFSNDVLLPGYPTRVYQNGDIFIDKNARVFEIDFNEGNLYKDTGIFLNTSGFFTSGPTQANSPEFERYSNSFDVGKYLIDMVYTNSVGDYTTYPTSIYGVKPLYYGQVKYIGGDVVTNPELGDYYPFHVWTIGSTDDADSIALVRSKTENAWRLGNIDGAVQRDASLFLDFTDLYCPSLGIRGTEAEMLYYDGSSGRIAKGPAGIVITNYAENRILTAGTSDKNINAESFLYYSQTAGNGTLLFDASGVPGLFDIRTINMPTTSSQPSTRIRVYSGNGASKSGANATGTGELNIYSGNGGAVSSGAFSGGDTGQISIITGAGGDSEDGDGGDAGDILIYAGNGGTNVDNGDYGGDGGYIRIRAGDGGDGGIPGNEGLVYIDGGIADGTGGNIYLNTINDGTVYTGDNLIVGGNTTTTALTATGRILSTLAGSAATPTIGVGATNTGFLYIDGTGTQDQIRVTIAGTEEFAFHRNASNQGDFYATGNVIAYGTLPSDIRLKKEIKKLDKSLEKVLKLNPVEYIRKSTGDKHLGLIAQEVEPLIPEVIKESKILGEDENIIYKTINYDEIIPVLIGAIQEQQVKIDELEKIISEIKNN